MCSCVPPIPHPSIIDCVDRSSISVCYFFFPRRSNSSIKKICFLCVCLCCFLFLSFLLLLLLLFVWALNRRWLNCCLARRYQRPREWLYNPVAIRLKAFPTIFFFYFCFRPISISHGNGKKERKGRFANCACSFRMEVLMAFSYIKNNTTTTGKGKKKKKRE